MRRFAWAVLAAGMFVGTGAEAQVASDYGSAIYQTKRNCPADPTVVCNGVGTAQRVVQFASAGGAGQAATSVFTATGTGLGSTAFGSAAFGGFGLPELKASAYAVGDVRVSTFVAAYQAYTYTGDEDFDLLLNASFHIDDSSTDGLDGTYPGGAIASAGFTVWDAEDFFTYADEYFTGTTDGFSTPGSLYSQGFLFGTFECEDFEALADPVDLPRSPRATNYSSGALSGGETTRGIAQKNCGEQTLTISKGDQFVIAAYAQVIGNRNGFADATGTFNVNLDPAMSDADRARFESGVRLGLAAVPEPASWAMMIGGFGAAGGALRRRRALAPATALA